MKSVSVYVVGNCSSYTNLGKYKGIVMYSNRYKAIENKNIPDTEYRRLILMGIIDCISMLKEPCDITIHTKYSWGIREILNDNDSGDYVDSIPTDVVNYDLKSEILNLCKSRGHKIKGIVDVHEVNYAVIKYL